MHVFSIPDWIVCLRKSISRYVFLRSFFAIKKKVVYFPFSQACIRWNGENRRKPSEKKQFSKPFKPTNFFLPPHTFSTCFQRYCREQKKWKWKKFSIRRFMLRTYGNSVGVGNGNNPRALQESLRSFQPTRQSWQTSETKFKCSDR